MNLSYSGIIDYDDFSCTPICRYDNITRLPHFPGCTKKTFDIDLKYFGFFSHWRQACGLYPRSFFNTDSRSSDVFIWERPKSIA